MAKRLGLGRVTLGTALVTPLVPWLTARDKYAKSWAAKGRVRLLLMLLRRRVKPLIPKSLLARLMAIGSAAEMSKADIVKLGIELKAPLELTWSCYQGDETPCGRCDSCILRANGFKDAGYPDPALHA